MSTGYQNREKELIRAALSARERAYVPYSGYQVGAALLDSEGNIHTGCNVENASYPVTCCAERTALFKAVSEGARSFSAIAVVGGAQEEAVPLAGFAYPCGVCRQALWEFGRDLVVIVAKSETEFQRILLKDLLPHAFGGEHLENSK